MFYPNSQIVKISKFQSCSWAQFAPEEKAENSKLSPRYFCRGKKIIKNKGINIWTVCFSYSGAWSEIRAQKESDTVTNWRVRNQGTTREMKGAVRDGGMVRYGGSSQRFRSMVRTSRAPSETGRSTVRDEESLSEIRQHWKRQWAQLEMEECREKH